MNIKKKLSTVKQKVLGIKLDRRKIATVFMVVLTVLLFVAAVWGLFLIQRVKKVVIKGASPYSLEEIMEFAEVEYGEFLFSYDTDELEEKILSGGPYIKEVKVRRYWFSKMVITVESDTAHYYMKITENAKDCYLLSKDLRVLDYRSSAELLKGSGLVYLELPYADLATCSVGQYVEYDTEGKNAYVKETLEYFYSQDYAGAITAVGLKSRFEGTYIDFYGKCRIVLGTPQNIELKMSRAYEILTEEEKFDESYRGYLIINVSDPKTPITSKPEKLD